MCGIAGIISKEQIQYNISEKIRTMSQAIAHRGPDGEGFMLLNNNVAKPFFGSVTQSFTRKDLAYIPSTGINQKEEAMLAFAHRRLSIIDVTESGHQPMCSHDSKIWITYNGEIYNYLELREELKAMGYPFYSESDTEVVIAAYKEWGSDCVNRLNGMWAFCIYDTDKQICFASRDRLGVKPFYYINNLAVFAFASEQKAFIKAGLVSAKIEPKALHSYLVNGLLETEPENFFEGITELFPGNNLIYSFATGKCDIKTYYTLSANSSLDNLSDKELIEKVESVLYNAVKIRLRSDVEVGACLSGGIDSSVLCVLMADILKQPIHCFTSVFRGQTINEESFADIVAKQIHAHHKKVEPTINGFLNELDALVFSQDTPIWDSSTYAQFKVMELAKQNGIKVVIDGQGADELFAGYHHHFIAKWNNLSNTAGNVEMVKDIKAARKTFESPFVFYAKEKIKQKTNLKNSAGLNLLNKEFITSYSAGNLSDYYDSVNDQLIDDITHTRLKIFLKCEDRCGMWHSVESRTPFSDDIDLINLLFSFNGNRKIQNGISKFLLREATRAFLPKQIYTRYDKKGFETPMHAWTKQLAPVIIEEVKESKFELLNEKTFDKLNINNFSEAKMLFKLFILCRWKRVFEA